MTTSATRTPGRAPAPISAPRDEVRWLEPPDTVLVRVEYAGGMVAWFWRDDHVAARRGTAVNQRWFGVHASRGRAWAAVLEDAAGVTPASASSEEFLAVLADAGVRGPGRPVLRVEPCQVRDLSDAEMQRVGLAAYPAEGSEAADSAWPEAVLVDSDGEQVFLDDWVMLPAVSTAHA